MSTYSISGRIAFGINVEVDYSGLASGSVTSDSSGRYTIPALSNGTYTITPNDVFGITPPSQNVTISGADVYDVNFVQGAVGPYSGVIASVLPASDGNMWGLITSSPVGPQSSQFFFNTAKANNNNNFTLQVGQAVNFDLDSPGGGFVGTAINITNA